MHHAQRVPRACTQSHMRTDTEGRKAERMSDSDGSGGLALGAWLLALGTWHSAVALSGPDCALGTWHRALMSTSEGHQ